MDYIVTTFPSLGIDFCFVEIMKKRFLKLLLTSHDRLSDYGFGKLHQLIEAVPSTIEVVEKAKGVKYLRLKEALPPAKKVILTFGCL